MKTLVLAEKPSVGKDIARVLNCTKGGKGFLEGNTYIVTWALGHLVTLADPEKYDEKYKTWNLNDLPIIPQKLDLVVIKETSKQYHTVKEQLQRKDVTNIVIATDAGREGELVARWIIQMAKVNKPIKRLWISSVTDKAIKDGFSKLKDGKEYVNLFNSAQARSYADWIVGINATRALTTKFNAQLSCGRVQTPTLYMISKREEEIRNFVKQDFYGINLKYDKSIFIWHDKKSNETRLFDKNKIQSIFNSLKSADAKVIEVNKSLKKKYSPRLYDLTELQRDANKIFSFSPKETLSIMQKLYEQHKILTYPRTDSRYISSDIIETIPHRLKGLYTTPYKNIANKLLATKIKGNQNFVDNTKVTDHHAIIPTEEMANYSKLSDNERKIYDLVVKRFLSVLLPLFEYEETLVKIKLDEEFFVARGKIIKIMGYKEVNNMLDEEEENETSSQILPDFKNGDILKGIKKDITTGQTKPPAFFNEATLLSAMENPTRYLSSKDENIIKTLGDSGGLGTVATRADIIEKLYNTFVIEKKGKEIYTTSKGRQLLVIAPKDLKAPELTAKWEQKLLKISKGTLDKEVFLNEIKLYTKEIISNIKNSEDVYKHDNITTNKCPECGKFMLEVKGKKSIMLICGDRECGARKTVSQTTNATCPKCRKKLELIGDGDNRKFICKCGHKEKYSAFVERRKIEGDKLDKKGVQKYIEKINKEEKTENKVNQSMLDALKNLKF